MRNILISGATGFLGSNLIELLSKKNTKLHILVRKKNLKKFKKKKIPKNINLISFKNLDDLNNKLKSINAGIVIHCATHYVKKHKFEDLKLLNEANINFGNVLLENLNNLKVKKFINISTVWENYNGFINKSGNLYAAYKRAFNEIINFYKIINPRVKFYKILLADTFGSNDKREKLINVIKENIKNSKKIKLISKNSKINLLNIKDVTRGIDLVIKKKIKPDTYVLKNNKYFSFIQIINQIKKPNIKVNWIGKRSFKEKFFNYKTLPNWKPVSSDIKDIAKIINNNT